MAVFGGGCARTSCPRLGGTFVQLKRAEFSRTSSDWKTVLAPLKAQGVSTLIIQYTGDESGAFQGPQRRQRPVSALLSALDELSLKAWLGHHYDPKWPAEPKALHGLPSPLDADSSAEGFVALCAAHPSCSGFYLSNEIDDHYWHRTELVAVLRNYLVRVVARLDELSGGLPVGIAPFYTTRLSARAHADWWGKLLRGTGIDTVMLQDGVGTGRASPETAALYLKELRPVVRNSGADLWSVVELFRQTAGEPHDRRPFAAEPIDPELLARSLRAQQQTSDAMVAFSVLDYMNPRGSSKQQSLWEHYVELCE